MHYQSKVVDHVNICLGEGAGVILSIYRLCMVSFKTEIARQTYLKRSYLVYKIIIPLEIISQKCDCKWRMGKKIIFGKHDLALRQKFDIFCIFLQEQGFLTKFLQFLQKNMAFNWLLVGGKVSQLDSIQKKVIL